KAKAGDEPEAPQASEQTKASAVGDLKEELPGFTPSEGAPSSAQSSASSAGAKTPEASAQSGDYYNEKPLAAPATRKLARELGVDIRRVPPSGSAEDRK